MGSAILFLAVVVAAGAVYFIARDMRARDTPPPDDARHEVTASVDVPVEALVGGTWHSGRLTSFRQDAKAWQGYVEFADPAIPATWLPRDQVRTLDPPE